MTLNMTQNVILIETDDFDFGKLAPIKNYFRFVLLRHIIKKKTVQWPNFEDAYFRHK